MSTDPFVDDAYPHRVAVVDLGSNSVKMVCYSADHTGAYRPYHRESFRIRLDEYDDGVIREEPANRLMDILKLFQNIIRYERIDRMLAVATSAVRRARNREPFVSRIRDESGIEFRILSGEQEALYSYVGAATHLDVPNSVFFDVGGGSLDIACVRNHTVLKTFSLPLGALVMTRKFGDGDLDGDAIGALREHLLKTLPPPESLGPMSSDAVLVGVGGTLRAISRYAQAYESYPLKKIHNYAMDDGLIQNVAVDLLSRDISTLSRLYEVGGRADIIKAGAVIVLSVLDRFRLGSICVSSTGLREGVLAHSLRYPDSTIGDISPHHVRDMVRTPSWTPRICPGASDIVRALIQAGLLHGEEPAILQAAAAHLRWLRTFRDADDFLYRMLDWTSPLPHRIQLLSALGLTHAKKPKRTMLLMKRYNAMLRPGDRQLIKRLSPVLLLCDTVITAGAGLDVVSGGGRIMLDVRPNGRMFPAMVMRQRCRRVGEALNVRLDCNC